MFLKKSKSISCIIILLLCSVYAFSQSQGYISEKDRVVSGGKVYFDKKQPTFVKYKSYESGAAIRYSANQLVSFGYKDPSNSRGTLYVSKEIIYQETKQRVFLKVLVKTEEFMLLSLTNKRFFSEKNEVLEEITEEGFQDFLKENSMNCEERAWQLPIVKFQGRSLKAAFEDNNKSKCRNVLSKGLGLKVGFISASLVVNANSFAGNNTDNGFTMDGQGVEAGIFYRQPIFSRSHLAWFSELNVQYTKYQQSFTSDNEQSILNHDLQTAFTQLQTKLGLSYELNFNRIRPIFGVSGILNYNLAQQSDYLLAKANIVNNNIGIIRTNDIDWNTKIHYGVGFSAGSVFYYGQKNRAFKVQAEANVLFNGKNEFQQLRQFKLTVSSTIL